MSDDLLERLEGDVTDLATREALTTDDVCLLLTKLESVIKRAREAKEAVEKFCVQWMPANNIRELRIGDEVKYVGEKSREKCRNIPAAVTALYEVTGGDFDAFCDCLSSNAIKYGAARKVLGDKYAEHFETITEIDLLTDKPKKVLKSINEHFLR